MIDKLKCDVPSMKQMEYIKRVESIYIPEPTPTDTPFKKYGSGKLTAEERERRNNMPLGFTMCMEIFVDRYNTNAFIKKFTYEEYIKNKDIQELIKHFELDVDKFWLLTLFVYDYCTSLLYQGITLKLTPLEQLQKMVDIIGEAEEDMTLNFKAGKVKLKIDSPEALRFIADAIIEHAENSDVTTLKSLNKKTAEETSVSAKDSPAYAFFGNMLLRFLSSQPQVRAKRKANTNHSLKEMELVSLIIYFTGFSDNESWLCPGEKYLKSFIRQYKKDNKCPNNISNVYPEFSF